MIDRRPIWLSAWLWLVAVSLTVLAVGPALFLALVAVQPAGDLGSLREGVTLKNFAGAWEQGRLGWPFVNSVLVTVVRATLNVALAAAAAYPLARMEFRGRGLVLVLVLTTMMIPEQVIVVPMFRTVAAMGLYDTLLAVVLPFSVTAFGVFLCRQAFLAVPKSLEEAARMDGATSWGVFIRVMVPLSAPTLATLALFSVIGAWSELLWPLVVLSSEEKYTLPVAVNRLLGEFATNVRLAYAGSVLALLPILAVFLLSQRFLKAGAFAGAVKG
jgi:putative chitobiose transport system permease protein